MGGWKQVRLKCHSGHAWDYLPNFPDSRPCPTCGEPGQTDMAVRGHGGFKPPKNYDLELSDPLVLQSHLEQRQWCEQNILSGDRQRDTHKIIEDGPDFLKPFGNDPVKRKEAIHTKGYSQDGY
jgi:hypothetical protein